MFDDVLRDPKKKRMFGALGAVLIILGVAGVFNWEATNIELVDLNKKSSESDGGDGNETIELREPYHDEGTDTILIGLPVQTSATTKEYTFPVEENASSAIIQIVSDARDIDLYVYDPNGNHAGTSAGPDANEKVKLDANDLKRGGPGDWTVLVHAYAGFNLQYTYIIDVYYNVTLNETEEAMLTQTSEHLFHAEDDELIARISY